MVILSNFYISLGILLIVLLVLQEEQTSLMHKLSILLILSVGIFWLERPDFFETIWWQIRSWMDNQVFSGN